MKNDNLSILKKTLVLSILITLVSCKPTVPDQYIQPDDMENILYDYHLAEGFATNMDADVNNSQIKRIAYQEAILRKHGINQAEFDSSMIYYFRHTERLHKIYENISKRLIEHAEKLGTSNVYGLGAISSKGDTTNIWRGPQTRILLSTPPDNKLTFAIKADTSFHKGDILMLNFDNLFIVQEGTREAVAVLSIRFSNDSIVSRTQRFSNNSHNSIQIEDYNRVGIKEIKGLFILPNSLNNKSQSYKLVCLYNIQLVKMHAKETLMENHLQRDNETNPNMKESQSNGEKDENITGYPTVRNMSPVALPNRIR